MTLTSWLPFAEGALSAEGVVRTTFEFGRIQSNTDWILPVGVCVAIVLFVRAMYRRDSAELPAALGWFLTALRAVTFLGLLVLYLQPQWRSEREEVRNSRALLLVDTSLSMGLTDTESTGEQGSESRLQQVVAAFGGTDFLDQLRKTHDVAVWQFHEGLQGDRVCSLAKGGPAAAAKEVQSDSAEDTSTADEAIDWGAMLKPRGASTQLGRALQQLLRAEAGATLSGIVVLTDGGQNAGVALQAAVDAAQKAKVPIFPVGIGSGGRPANVRISDLVAPARAYPGDDFVVTGFLQAQQMAGQVVEVQLLWRNAENGNATGDSGDEHVEANQPVTLGGDGEVVPVKFTLTPEKTGRRTFRLRIQNSPRDDDPADNDREVDVEIVDRRNRVLMIAGGPMREYRFLRNQLYRDRSATVDVFVQSGQPGMSQDADKLLDEMPTTREEMYQYDCMVACDPDWRALSPVQVDLVEQWVADQGGGLIVIAGPVFAGQTVGGWVEDAAMKKIRDLYPVEFDRRYSSLENGTYVSKEAWPLEFTREGLQSEFLWLEDTAAAGRQAWDGFEGVYSYCPVDGPKPGATVLARFSDPRTGRSNGQPVYFAAQFYGSGRVFYIGSGEMWRLRRVDETYFERFYTKLIRHVSQGRLLRGSSRGVLLVGQDRYLLGNTVEVRAQLTDLRLEPLRLPGVAVQIVQPDGAVETITLQGDSGHEGTYAGRFPVLQEGVYRLELPVPESEDERLTRRIQVRVPDLERENPQRNDALLSRLAQDTGGKYYVGLQSVLDTPGQSLGELLKDRTTTEVIPMAPDPDWQRTWLTWMMLALCGLLCVEWLVRRLVRLA